MNRIKEVAKVLGVELYEPFKIGKKAGMFGGEIYEITQDPIFPIYSKSNGGRWERLNELDTLYDLITGKLEIIKIPYKPKEGAMYYWYNWNTKKAVQTAWVNTIDDIYKWKLGNCFRTEEEAMEKGKEIEQNLRKEFEEGEC